MYVYFVIVSKAVASDEFYLRPARHVVVRLTVRVQPSACSFDAFCDVPRWIIFLLAVNLYIDVLRLVATLGRKLQQGEERHEASLVQPLNPAEVIVHLIDCSYSTAECTADERRAIVSTASRRRITTSPWSRCLRLQLYRDSPNATRL